MKVFSIAYTYDVRGFSRRTYNEKIVIIANDNAEAGAILRTVLPTSLSDDDKDVCVRSATYRAQDASVVGIVDGTGNLMPTSLPPRQV